MSLRSTLLEATFAVVLTLVVGVGRVLAQESTWFVGGTGLVDDTGEVYVSASLPTNLVASGLTYVRVTSGPCEAPASDYVVYEAELSPASTSTQLYVGVLEPIGRFATPVTTPPGAFDVFLFGRGDTGGFTVVLNGQTPSVTFTVCFRAP